MLQQPGSRLVGIAAVPRIDGLVVVLTVHFADDGSCSHWLSLEIVKLAVSDLGPMRRLSDAAAVALAERIIKASRPEGGVALGGVPEPAAESISAQRRRKSRSREIESVAAMLK